MPTVAGRNRVLVFSWIFAATRGIYTGAEHCEPATAALSNLLATYTTTGVQLIELLPELREPSARWLGPRPALPDSLPVSRRSPRARRVIHALRRGHLG